ncbi:hypothetical protein [uncultured Sphaerochaeta sp.]|uniref:hypothetical protein n=1 Tax=uncultured Sphaerochaeta sp. TaxID=886478 RepID=UPI00261F3AA7|nr:hypothetical protein [uncultured Sphaerochaeta sp.]
MEETKNTINDPTAHALIAEKVCGWEKFELAGWGKWINTEGKTSTYDMDFPLSGAESREAAIDEARLKGFYVSAIPKDSFYLAQVEIARTGVKFFLYKDERGVEKQIRRFATKAEAEFYALLFTAQELEKLKP